MVDNCTVCIFQTFINIQEDMQNLYRKYIKIYFNHSSKMQS